VRDAALLLKVILLAGREVQLKPPAAGGHRPAVDAHQQPLRLKHVEVFADGDFGDPQDLAELADGGAVMRAQVAHNLLAAPLRRHPLLDLCHRLPLSAGCLRPVCVDAGA